MSDYRDIFSNSDDRQGNKEGAGLTFSGKVEADHPDIIPTPDDNAITPEEIMSTPTVTTPAPTPTVQDDDFVIGGGFKISDDYASRIRSRKECAMEQGSPRPLSKRDVDMRKLSKENAREKKQQNKKPHGPLYTVMWAVIIVLVSALMAWMLILGANDLLGLVGDKSADVQIEKGMNVRQIANLLEEEGVIDYPLLFRLYVKFKGEEGSLKYGGFTLTENMGYDGIIEQLQKSNERKTVKVTIPDGATVESIRKLLEENKVCTAKDFNYILKHIERYDFKYDFVDDIPIDNVYYSFEGYLYPDTYEFFTMVDNSEKNYSESNAVHAINRMMGNLDQKLKEECPDYKEKIKKLKKYGIEDLHDVLAMASIVQMECSGFDSEMPKVASVFLNRLVWENQPHYLGSTPTFYYPDNRYNTNNYELYGEDGNRISKAGFEGLPPGPQCSSTISAIKAVLEPDESTLGNAYYFVTDKNHKFYYNRTLAQHNSTISTLKRKGLWA